MSVCHLDDTNCIETLLSLTLRGEGDTETHCIIVSESYRPWVGVKDECMV